MESKKNPKADVGKNGSIYFAVGLALMLFLTYSTINWKTYDKSDIDIGKVDPNYLYEVLSKMDLNGAEVLFISCTALPALSIIDSLEKRLNKIVLSSNQALIWDSLNQINNQEKIEGFGKLFNS